MHAMKYNLLNYSKKFQLLFRWNALTWQVLNFSENQAVTYVILAVWSDTLCHTLVHELGRDQPNTTKSCLISPPDTPLAGGVLNGDTFVLGNGKVIPSGGQAAPSWAISKGMKKGAKGGKKG
jgi:hypothetical protein